MAAKTRINITIDSETLRLADRAARKRKVSRSELIRVAVRQVAGVQDRLAQAEARHERQRRAVEGLHWLARRFGDWPAEKILRAARDRWHKRSG